MIYFQAQFFLKLSSWDGVQGSLGNVQSKTSANTAIGESSLISVVISTTNSRPIVFNPKLLMSKIPAAIIKDYFYITEFFISSTTVDRFNSKSETFLQVISLLTSSYPQIIKVMDDDTV